MAGTADRIYLDLANEIWQCVEIGPDGWRIVGDPPVRFVARPACFPSPRPSVADRLIASAHSSIFEPMPISSWSPPGCWQRYANRRPLSAVGAGRGTGIAKSTLAAMLRALVDPNVAPLRALPRDDRDLFIAASNGHVLAFDNVPGCPLLAV